MMSGHTRRGWLRIRVAWVLLALAVLGAWAFRRGGRQAEPVAGARRTLVLATTTSVHDSGLLDRLLPRFQAESGLYVRTLAVGSGKAMELGRLGEADVILSHSPALELAFVEEGFGESRRPVATNDFVLVGPEGDPAGARTARTPAEALRRIARSRARFISRGDGSGTHAKDQALWQKAGLRPDGDWYESAGTGMGAVLRRADERGAYALADRATFMAYRTKIRLRVVHEGGADLENPYSVIVVAPGGRGGRQAAEARRFAEFLAGTEGQRLIGEFGREQHGEALFRPVVGE